MDQEAKIKFSLLSIGSLLVATSFTLVGFYAFQGGLAEVVAGFLIFVVGYKTCWYGTHHKGGLEDLKAVFLKVSREGFHELFSKPFNYLLILIGISSAGYGTMMFAEVVTSFSVQNAIISGAFTFGGYVIAHEGVNEVPI